MPRRSRINLTVNRDDLILNIRLFSSRDAAEDHPDLIDQLKEVGEPWLYNAIFDFTDYQADLSRDYLAFLTQKWADVERGRDSRKCMAIVAGNAFLRSQLMTMLDAMPQRLVGFFREYDEALDWVLMCGTEETRLSA